MKTVFLRVLNADDKAAALVEAVADPVSARERSRFEVDPGAFASVPRSPFAYWVRSEILDIFASARPLHSEARLVASTNPLNDDFRWARAWWEVAAPGLALKWMPWAKGGAYSPVFYDIDTVIAWDGRRMTYSGYLGTPNRPLERPASVQHFFRPGLTWPRRTNGLSIRVMPTGCIFADKGPAIFVENDGADDLLALACVVNSRAFALLVSLQVARTELAQSYEVGLIQTTPVPVVGDATRKTLACLARRVWALRRSLDTGGVTSHAFTLPALLQMADPVAVARADAWSRHVREIESELACLQSEIDDRCFELYGIDQADRRATCDDLGAETPHFPASEAADDGDDAPGAEGAAVSVKAVTLAAELIEWAVGVVYGRFDVRLATGERGIPREPEPFDPLPACSPGMLTGTDGLPTQEAPDAYPLGWPSDGIMVDDAGHPEDLAARVRDVFEVVFGAVADAWWQECVRLLGRDLRLWLARSFFGIHLKSYSKSRRKAPIYWQLGTPTASYSVWLYAHRASPDTLFRVLNDFVTPKLRHEKRKLTSLIQEAGPSPSASQRKVIESQRGFVEELRSFRDAVARVAPLWRPELDDGVLITCAPLWRLLPQHRIWQRETKACWLKLTKGDFDWAHLAMHLWPERVIPKCAHDRSLAIAHGLEDEFWAEDADGKWASRQVDAATVERLVQERSSTAVKAALSDLLAAG